jgi:hypothetical protein
MSFFEHASLNTNMWQVYTRPTSASDFFALNYVDYAFNLHTYSVLQHITDGKVGIKAIILYKITFSHGVQESVSTHEKSMVNFTFENLSQTRKDVK